MLDDDDPTNIEALIAVMNALRTPGTGCPWDLEQTFETIAPYTIEEAYEVADAIANGTRNDLKEELGDLLLQVVYHSRMAEEEGSFAFPDVAEAITDKMIRRHPRVFDKDHVADADALWESGGDLKAAEKARKASEAGSEASSHPESALDGVALALPALTRALKLQKKASRVGFEWSTLRDVLAKIKEEISEVDAALENEDQDSVREEIGDLLFAVTNLARHVDVDAEHALGATNTKFVRRFEYVESRLRERDRSLSDTSLAEMNSLWDDAKFAERKSS